MTDHSATQGVSVAQGHTNIASALAAAQAEMGRAIKDSSNPHFRSKYADLGNVMDACMEALTRHGIAVVQPMIESDMGNRYVVTRFIHASGEVLENPVPLILAKNDMQGLGSAYTYARRYGLMGLAGVAPEDDDGNAAAASAPKNDRVSPMTATWGETVLQDLPEGATNHDKAVALKDALVAQFKRKKSKGELSNEWDRRKPEIDRVQRFNAEMHAEIVDAYENRMIAVAPDTVAAE